jgi:hypothetical protein
MSKDPSNPGVDLCITQFCGEGTVRTTWPQIYPHDHSSLTEWLNLVAEKGLKEGHARQPSSQHLLDDLTQGLQPAEVPLGHAVPPVGLGNRWPPVNTGSGTSVPFLRKDHTFRHPSKGPNVGRWKWVSTPRLDLMKMSTMPKAATPVPCCSQARKK